MGTKGVLHGYKRSVTWVQKEGNRGTKGGQHGYLRSVTGRSIQQGNMKHKLISMPVVHLLLKRFNKFLVIWVGFLAPMNTEST